MALTLFVKGSDDRKGLGDCPFSQRIVLVLSLKGLQFVPEYVDPSRRDLRKWNEFIQRTQCKRQLPILIHGEAEPIEGSDTIEEYLELFFPEQELGSLNEDANAAGRDLYSKFASFMRNNDASKDEILRKSLKTELEKLNTYLATKPIPGSFLDGDHLKLPDCKLLPKLLQVKVAGELKGFSIPDTCSLVAKYLDDAHRVKAVKDVFTDSVKDEIKKGWKQKMGNSTK